MATSRVRGSCLCGDLQWEIEPPLAFLSHCYCSMCRRTHGAGFGSYAGGSADTFKFLSGEDAVVSYRSAEGGHRAFCGRCGAVAPGVSGGMAFMAAGCFDDDPGIRAAAHIFVASKAPWVAIPPDDLPRFDAYPPELGQPEVESPVHGLPELSAPGRLRGGCLCGGVAYEVGPAPGLVHCHCSRCRKSRSAAFASNLMAEADAFRYTRGGELVRSFKVPDADRFTTAFCSICGSCLPRDSGGAPFVVVPAGSVQTDFGDLPQVHIFVGSKAAWFGIRDDVPQSQRYPDGYASSHEWAAAQRR